MVNSKKDICEGEPCIEGHEITVRHIVVNVNCLGLEGYVGFYIYDRQLCDEKIGGDKIEEAVEYCRTEQCDVDNANGKLVRYCQGCSKERGDWNGWKTAQKLYQLHFEPESDS